MAATTALSSHSSPEEVQSPYEAMVNAKCITPELIRRMCLGDLSEYDGYT
jgi:hypothetical protein